MKAMERPAKHFLESFLSTDVRKAIVPTKVQRVHCPTCGSHAERYHEESTVRTQCSRCDYLMTICTETGRVIEAYAPSFSPSALTMTSALA
jgi:hypothetical protein